MKDIFYSLHGDVKLVGIFNYDLLTMDVIVRKNYFVRILKERLFLRFHMSLILVGTALAGLLASKLLLLAHVHDIVIRYPLAVIVSYLAFFGFVKLWLSYMASSDVHRAHGGGDAVADTIDGISNSSGSGSPGHEFPGGGGGHFGGGGASGSFDAHVDMGAHAHDVIADTAAHASHGIGDAVGHVAGEAASGIAEEGACVLVILGVLLAIVFGAGLYLVYDAPFILSEAAFDFILAASLIRSARRLDDPDWKGSVLRTTWIPFAIVLLISFCGAYILHITHPEAHKLSEIIGR